MFMHPVLARDVVAERQSAARVRAAEIRRASHARNKAGIQWIPVRPRGRPRANPTVARL
jgi:hypothetical protein